LAMITGGGDDTSTATTLVELPAMEMPSSSSSSSSVLDDELNKHDGFTSIKNAGSSSIDNFYCQVAAGGAWQRRTPHATVNVLRADQLEIAEKKRNSAKLYPKNIAKLLAIGNDQLQQDLNRERNLK
jgi:hypothetical protein